MFVSLKCNPSPCPEKYSESVRALTVAILFRVPAQGSQTLRTLLTVRSESRAGVGLYMSPDLKFGLYFILRIPDDLGGPPWEHGTLTPSSSELREAFLIIFDFLKSSWFEVIARTKNIFFGSLGSVDLVLWSEKLAILLWCLSKEMKWLERHCTYSE